MKNTRDALISYLKSMNGQWVSGSWLSRQLDVSRMAISKHISRLQRQGYAIESSTRKGYLLLGAADLVSPYEVKEGLKTRAFGAGKILCLEETDSTNLRAKQLAEDGAPEGTVVIAEKQTAGRGRKGRAWVSPAGAGVYMSLILRPVMNPAEAPGLTLLMGVTVAEALHSLAGLNATIKWPNDVLVNGKKIAGILIEISAEMDRIQYVIVGLGINVNLPSEGLADEIRKTATSVLIETGKTLDRVAVIRELLQSFEAEYRAAQRKGFDAVRQRWKTLSNIIGRRVRVETLGKKYSGVVSDIDRNGFLILKTERGEHRIMSGDVALS